MEERMNIVIVGHVDHGKSTLIGRLLVDTNSLPQGKLEQVRKNCERNSKPFEYAFLLDALQDEQAQGITIDTARIFFRSKKREYIIIDAPGHIEFLKNMVSGAARAEAALLIIDALEGIAENSKRHAYMLSMLGIQQVGVVINKMDLVNYDKNVFDDIKNNYDSFLSEIGIKPITYIPVSSKDGINVTDNSALTSWYNGPSIINIIDTFNKEKEKYDNNFRMFVQGIYKFTSNDDNRRIIAGTVNSGTLNVGDEVIFLPSGKKSVINTIEAFNKNTTSVASSGEAIGVTLKTQIYIKPSELMCKINERLPQTSNTFTANIFWMGKNPFETNKKFKLKLGTNKAEVYLDSIEHVLNASDLTNSKERDKVYRHEVAQCTLRTTSPISFDLVSEITDTSRFVIVDDYDIAGGGIIIDDHSNNELELNGQKADKENNKYSDFEIELNQLIRKHFPHWEAKALTEI